MSIVCDWLVLCEQVICDRQNGSLTLVNCLDSISAAAFPAEHPRFAFAARFRWSGDEPAKGEAVQYRVVRYSKTDPEEEVSNLTGAWAPGVPRSRVYVNFHLLRLRRAEDIWFRIDWRVAGGEWQRGPAVPIQVAELQLSPQLQEQVEHLEQEKARARATEGKKKRAR
jgi:hypothetical protein